MNEEVMKKESKLLNKIKSASTDIIEVFKEKPATMGAILLLSFVFSMQVYYNNDNVQLRDFLDRAMAFLLLFAGQVLFFEELFYKKLSIRVGGYIYSSVFSGVITYIISTYSELDDSHVFGMEYDLFMTYLSFFLVVYYGILILLSVYHMYIESKLSFERYCIDTFGALIRAVVVYGLFAGGLAIIILIFNELIFDTNHFLARLEIFLSAGILVPLLLLALSRKKDMYGKFSKVVMLYVLEPMMMLAYLIIYIYIIKIVATNEIPSNSVFGILAFMFSVAMPVWTMEMGIEDAGNALVKIARYLPIVFIPFIFLQIYAIGIRIVSYGVTSSRYAGVILIIFEVIYMILYLIQFIKGKESVKYIFFVAMGLLFFAFWCPFTNVMDVVVRSQTARIERFFKDEVTSEYTKNQIVTAYDAATDVSLIAKIKIDKKLTEDQLDLIDEYGRYRYYYNDQDELTVEERINYFWDNRENGLLSLDISNFKSMSQVSFDVTEDLDVEELSSAIFYRGRYYYESSDIIILNIRDFIEEAVTIGNDDGFLDRYEFIDVGDGRSLYITNINMEYYEISKKITRLDIQGYLFE